LNQHFTGARGTSSRDERNLYTTEPINFPSETERLMKKPTCIERSNDLHPVPMSSSSESTSHVIGEELNDKVNYSVRDYNSQLPGKEDAAGTSKESCETRPETILPEHDESVQSNACIARTLDGNANPALEHQAPQMSHQILDSLLSDADKNEGKIKTIESKVQVPLRGDLYASTFAHADVSTDSTQTKGVSEMSEKDSNTDLGKQKQVIEVADLASIGEEEASKPFKSHGKHNAKALNPAPLPAENNMEAPRATRVDEKRPEDTQEHRGFRRLKDREKPDNTSKGRPIGRESEANSEEQRWQESGSEVWWRVTGSTEPQSTTSTKELFTCQEAESCEKSSVSEQGIAEKAEAGTVYLIKTTSESAPEKMPGSEKAVIAKLPRETALSDRPTEEKETAFDTHEGRNDGSHYALCQLNTVGVLYDNEFEKKSVLGIYNACVHETLQGETKSVCNSREKCAKAQPDNILPVGEAVKASAMGKKDLQEGLFSEVPESPLSTQKHLYHEKAEELYREESHVETLSCLCSKAETKMPPSGTNTVPSYHYKSSSVASSEGSTVEGGMEHLYRYFESKVIDKVAAESWYNLNLTNEITCINKNFSSEVEKGEVPSTSDTAISGEGRGRNTGRCFHQPELQQEKSWRPEVLISKSTKENGGTDSQADHLITERKTLNWLDDSQKASQHTSDSADISNQKSEALKLPSESPGLKHIAFKIFYFFLFLLFAATLYHYDLMVCLALYLFSLYWLYHEGRRNKESIKKE
ncbi:PPR3A phosphatase, partial [Drymodes brunneopygia]|nr:PPR3A phosphatase [Drymodes brunneopygia]